MARPFSDNEDDLASRINPEFRGKSRHHRNLHTVSPSPAKKTHLGGTREKEKESNRESKVAGAVLGCKVCQDREVLKASCR
jgi:hypothetical protein